MAYLDISKKYVLTQSSITTETATVLDGKYRVQLIEDLWIEVPKNYYYQNNQGRFFDKIAEGQQVYIADGNHKGEIWVLIDKQNIAKPIFEYDQETGVEIKTEGPHGWRLLGQESHGLNWEQL